MILAAALILGAAAPAAAQVESDDVWEFDDGKGTLTLTSVYETKNSGNYDKDRFPLNRDYEGTTYVRDSMNVEILENRPEKVDIYLYETENFTDKEGHEPPDIMETDGKNYHLKEKELVETYINERKRYAEAKIPYDGIEDAVAVPSYGTVTVTDEDTGQEITEEMPLVGIQKETPYWSEDFEFPISVSEYDADYYMLGDVHISKGEDLSQYGREFLNYLGLSEDSYQVDRIEWTGYPYEREGEVRRDAIAYGRKLVYDAIAVYGGIVTIPGIEGYHYKCQYEHIPEDSATVYTVKATVSYLPDQTNGDRQKSLWELFWDWIWNLIQNHPVVTGAIGLLLLLLLIAVLIWLLTRKQEKKTPSKAEKNRGKKNNL